MKRKTIATTLLCVLLALFALGAAGILHIGGEETGMEREPDRLIGVLVTREHLDLFDAEGFFNANANKLLTGGEISPAESAAWQGRLYASPVEREDGSGSYTEYAFDNVEGYAMFSAFSGSGVEGINYSSGDEAISDGKTHLSYTDEGKGIDLEGTIYVSAENGPQSFFCNPVYQGATGEVYALTGQGMTISGEISDGMSHSTWMKEEQKRTDGADTEAKSVSSEIKLTVTYILPPQKLILSQLDGDNKVIAQAEYAPGELPETLKTERGTEYIILASVNAEGTKRELFQRGDEYLEAFLCREDGICIKTGTALSWSGK